MSNIERKLEQLGLVLPNSPAPVANYVPYTISGNLVFISGQISIENGEITKGILGETMDVEAGMKAARQCGFNLIAQLNSACKTKNKTLDNVTRVVRLGGFVACTASFTDHPKVINGASDLMVEVFGDNGRHARAAVGTPSLPLGAAVEIDGIFEIG